MSRATGPVRFRLSSPSAQRYSEVGRKLLGELLERQKHGPNVGVLHQTLADGAKVSAWVEGRQHIVRIIEPPAAGSAPAVPPEPAVLEGFVVSPGGLDPDAFNEVLLQPGGRDRWRVHFFSSEERPVDYPTRSGIYSKAGDKPLLDAPDGLKRMGNVDWRNQDETLSVSWTGPDSRYFFDTDDRDSVVYYKGAVLVDLADYHGALFGSGNSEVVGACLLPRNGLSLMVALRRFTGAPLHHEFDTVVLIPLRLAAGYSLPRSGRLAEVARLAPAVSEDTPEDDIVILLDRAVPDDEDDVMHPWCFNSSGTQARRMRQEPDVRVVEQIITIDEDFTAATYTEVHEPWPQVTTTTHRVQTTAPVRIDGSFQGVNDDATAPSGPVGGLRTLAVVVDDDKEWELDQVVAFEATTQVTTDRLRVAVDFRGDTPTYAFVLGETTSSHGLGRSERSSSYVSTIDGVTTVTHAGTPNCLASLATSGHNEELASWHSESSTVGVLWGLETDWQVWRREVDVGAQEDGSGDYTQDFSNSQTSTTTQQHPPWGVASAAMQALGSLITVGTDRSGSEHDYRSGYYKLAYLDLRYRWLVYSTLDASTDVDTVTVRRPFTDDQTASGTIVAPGFVTTTTLTGDSQWYDPPGIFVIGYGNPLDVPAIEIGDTTQTTTTRTEERLHVQLGEHTLLDLQSALFAPDAGVTTTPFTVRNRYGAGIVLTMGTFGGVRHAGRTEAAFLAIPALLESTSTSDTGGASNGLDFGDFSTIEGAWQTYRGKYCYSLRQRLEHGSTYAYAGGVGRDTGAPSAFSLAQLTGFAGSPAQYWPLTILPPTAR